MPSNPTLPEEAIHLLGQGSWITLCCHRHAIDERIKLGTYDPESATCKGAPDDHQ